MNSTRDRKSSYGLVDQETLAAFKAGDRQAFATVYAFYHHRLGGYAYNHCKMSKKGFALNGFSYEDAVQEAFINLFNYRAGLQTPLHLQSLLFMCCRHTIRKVESRVLTEDKF